MLTSALCAISHPFLVTEIKTNTFKITFLLFLSLYFLTSLDHMKSASFVLSSVVDYFLKRSFIFHVIYNQTQTELLFPVSKN